MSMLRWSEDQYREHMAKTAPWVPLPKPIPTLKAVQKGASDDALGRLESGQMNKTEARFEANYLRPLLLAGEILEYGFERVKLRLAKATFITFDFDVVNRDGALLLYDVKGRTRDDAAVKMKTAAQQYRYIRFYTAHETRSGGPWRITQIERFNPGGSL